MKIAKKILKYLGIFLLCLIVLIVALYFINQPRGIKKTSQYTYAPHKTSVESQSTSKATTVDATMTDIKESGDEWITYTNTDDGYSFMYPKSWHMIACSNGYYPGNIYLDPDYPQECGNFDPIKAPSISISADFNLNPELASTYAQKQMGMAANFVQKTTEINGVTYPQLVMQLKIIPPFLLRGTQGVTTYIYLPERGENISVGLIGLGDDRPVADVYRQIIDSIKPVGDNNPPAKTSPIWDNIQYY